MDNLLNDNISLKEKVAYSLPSFVRGISSQLSSFFLVFYYTDILFIPVKIVSVLFFCCKIFDALNDQIIGFMMEKKVFKKDRYKPYILWSALPLAVFSVLLFSVPDFSITGKVIYCFLIYSVWDTIQSFISIASNSLLATITKDEKERITLNSFKICASIISIIIVSYFIENIVNFLGQGNSKIGFFKTILIFSVIGLPIQIYSYFNINERYNDANKKSVSFKQGVKIIFSDKQTIMILLIYLFFNIANTFKNQSSVYFVKHVLQKPEIMGTFFILGIGVSFLMQFTFKYLIKCFSAEVLTSIGLLGSFISMILMSLVCENIYLVIFFNIIFGIFSALPANLIYIITAKKIDSFLKIHNLNLNSILYATLGFFSKIGIGLGGYFLGKILHISNYDAQTVLTSKAVSGIYFNFFGGTIIALIISFILINLFIKFEDNSVVDHLDIR